MATCHFHNTLLVFLGLALFGFNIDTVSSEFPIREATVRDIQIAFHQNKLTSKLVLFYIREIERLNPVLRAVIEVNPDAIKLARKADLEREANATVSRSLLHGIPILVKDNIATKDKMNTTVGSYAQLGSVVPRDAGVVVRLRKAGAIILGKASCWKNSVLYGLFWINFEAKIKWDPNVF
ncbi:unnamed protein product [Camellia sinensis]